MVLSNYSLKAFLILASIAYKVEMDSFSLASLHNRIKDAAYSRFKANSVDEANPTSPFPKGLDSMPCMKHKYMARSQIFSDSKPRVGGARKKYQDMLQVQQVASVYVDEYCMIREALRAAQRTRLESLGNCRKLLRELSNPLSLEDAAKALSDDDPASPTTSTTDSTVSRQILEVPLDNLRDAVETHLKTADAIEAMSKSRSKGWSVINAPFDVTGPPVDVMSLRSVQYDTLMTPLSDERFRSIEDKEESLLWVSYAAKTLNPTNDGDRQPTSDAQRLLDHVDADELIKRVYADLISAAERNQLLNLMCDQEDIRVNRLAKALVDEVLSRIEGKNIVDRISAQDEVARQRHLSACIQIQAFVRGVQSRELTKAKRAEQRVMKALGILLNELSLPELRRNKLEKGNMVSKLLGNLQSRDKEQSSESRKKPPQGMKQQESLDKRSSGRRVPRSDISETRIITEDQKYSSPTADAKFARDLFSSTAQKVSPLREDPAMDTSLDPLSYISSPTAEGSSYELSASLDPSTFHDDLSRK